MNDSVKRILLLFFFGLVTAAVSVLIGDERLLLPTGYFLGCVTMGIFYPNNKDSDDIDDTDLPDP